MNNIVFEECHFLGCGAVFYFCEPTFRRNVSPSTSGWKHPRARNQRVQVAAARGIFYHVDEGDTFLRNVGSHKYNTATYPRKRHSL
jgi:hypothetical protein